MISKLFRNNNDEMIEISYDGRQFYVKNQDRDNIHTYGYGVAKNIYHDWALEGIDLVSVQIPPEN